MNYRWLKIGSGVYYNLNLSYRRQERSTQDRTLITGIDQISESFYNTFPENQYSFSGALNKRWQQVSAGISTQVSLSDYTRIINLEKLNYKSNQISYSLNIRTLFTKLPNIHTGFQHRLSNSKNQNYKNQYRSLSPFIGIEYGFLNGFTFKSNYYYTYTKDQTQGQSQTFQMGNASLFYRQKDSPWGFEIRIDNAFNVRSKRLHHINEFIIYDQQVMIQPRTVLLILSYQP